jgi:fructosamine-3-kinase
LNEFRSQLADALGCEIARLATLGGGDVADAYRVELDDGRTVFAKTKRGALPGFFTTEARGLAWLREADAVPVPEVVAVSDDPPFLVLEWIDPGRADATTDACFGRALAALHAKGAACFGREDRRTTGSRGLPNEPCDTWETFYAENRLRPLARLASDAEALPSAAVRDLESLAGRLADLGGPAEPPARLHGDLWGGNRLVDVEGRNWLVDPAAHGGHREFDLAMMRLFGGFAAPSFAAYDEVAPLATGWEERVPLHQIAPLVVHAIKFGGGYVSASVEAIRRFS